MNEQKKISIFQLSVKSFRHYRRLNMLLILGVMVTSMTLTGALLIGDSVRFSLKRLFEQRTGKVKWAMQGGDLLMPISTANDLSNQLKVTVCPVLLATGTVSNPGKTRVNKVQVIGVDKRFFEVGPEKSDMKIAGEYVWVNEKLAERLNIKNEEDCIIRIKKSSSFPSDSPFAPEQEMKAFRVKIRGVLSSSAFGNFSLKMNHQVPFNIFVPLDILNEKMGCRDQINTLLIEDSYHTREDLYRAFKRVWEPTFSVFTIKDNTSKNIFELKSKQIFFPDHLERAFRKAYPQANYIFSYFVNSIRHNKRIIPYSIVSSLPSKSFPEKENIILNEWAMEDLDVRIGDRISLEFYVIDEFKKLKIESKSFVTSKVVPNDWEFGDPELMPEFPGMTEAGNCSEWDAGVPINFDKIRKKDEDYWENYRGTPKAFIPLDTAKEIWGNPFGSLTGIRFPLSEKSKVLGNLETLIEPESLGLVFRNIKEQGKKSFEDAVDFSGLFLGLTFFILISSLILTGLLFLFYIEHRVREIGTLHALGFHKKLIQRIYFLEGGVVALTGAALGAFMGIFYQEVIIWALQNLWNGAIHTQSLSTKVAPFKLFLGFISSSVFSFSVIALRTKRILAKQISLLQRTARHSSLKGPVSLSFVKSALSIILVIIILVIWQANVQNTDSLALFCIAGSLVLFAASLVFILIFKKKEAKTIEVLDFWEIGVRNITRKLGPSLSVMVILSIGIFMIVAISSQQYRIPKNPFSKSSGTGGFHLFMEAGISVPENLNHESVRNIYAMNKGVFSETEFVSLRLKEGDDASCLNLNRAIEPSVLGVNPKEFAKRESFSFQQVFKMPNEIENPWMLLDEELEDGVIPAIADSAVIQWALGKKIGDTLSYHNEQGKPIRLKFVAGLSASVLQGYVIISEKNFIKHFPSISGFRVFLAKVTNNRNEVIDQLYRTFSSFGVEITGTGERLSEFKSVENTYLSIFGLLGGLGLIIGTFGFGILLLRNIFERKGEIALLRALGYRKTHVFKMFCSEYVSLLIWGTITGAVSALIAVFPILYRPGRQLPLGSVLGVIGLIVLTGVTSIIVAGFFSMRGNLLNGLRKE